MNFRHVVLEGFCLSLEDGVRPPRGLPAARDCGSAVRPPGLATPLLALLLALCPSSGQGADPFAENIRTTPWLSPEQERQTFHLPPGFDINVFAAEPDIAKPMNMAFDERGRLWVTVTVEYPFPVPPGEPSRDAIKVLEDTDGDGRADKVTTFVDGLDIPIGIYPWRGGVIAWSIPNIWYFQDTDGDGRADKREVLYGPFGWEHDTHGMNSSFTRGFDGWLFATHGYANDSKVRGKDGHEVTMNSGNTYRMRLDGARLEQHTWGQVNPFGLCFDALGNLYSADCHSEPEYQLLRGGHYPSFGKPHDGLGFAPSMIFHGHGSTAICGIVLYADDQWPAEYSGNLFTGNVMTSRVDWDALTWDGSTPTAKDRGPFVSTDDPWFRPVNIQLGPDGAMYVADFYNRIIGHYEVALTHPGRDRTSGRIWRITYTGAKGAETSNAALPSRRYDISTASVPDLIVELAHPNLTRRMLAMNQISDRVGPVAIQPLERLLAASSTTAFQKVHALWLLYRFNALGDRLLAAGAREADARVRVHAMRILSETAGWSPALRELALAGLADRDALVQRCAAEALGAHPDAANITPLLAFRHKVPAEDTHLLYVARKALRDQLRAGAALDALALAGLGEADARAVADVVPSIPTAAAAAWLLSYLQRYEEPPEPLGVALRHAARYLPEGRLDELARFVRARFAGALDLQLALFDSVRRGAGQRGVALTDACREWGGALADQLLASLDDDATPWQNTPIRRGGRGGNPWTVQMRPSADGNSEAAFLTTLPTGEQSTGILRSKPFPVPARLSFFLAGHDGSPDKPPQKKNVVRLVSTGPREVLAEAWPPRNDLAQPVNWDLAAHAGREALLEITDADAGGAYAWLAVGRFDPPVVTVPALNPGQITLRGQAAAEIARELSLRRLEPRLARLLSREGLDLETRGAAARAVAGLRGSEGLAVLAPLLADPGLPEALRAQITRAFLEEQETTAQAALAEALRTAPERLQVRLAQSLAGSPGGAERLLGLVAEGQASARLLLERNVKDKLEAAQPGRAADRVARLTAGLAPPDEARLQLLEARRAGFDPARAQAAEGLRLFTTNCAACHQIDGQGALIGPQLDGIGGRGLERLAEDVLDPNRNVDRAFRTTLITLDDGDVLSGLFRREEGEMLVLAESTGKEFSVPQKKVKERRESESSLMPDNFGELLTPEQFNHLMAFLLSKAGKVADKKQAAAPDAR